MTQDFKCFIGLHKDEVIQQENVVQQEQGTDENGHQNISIKGLNIVCRCANCGRIKSYFIPTSTDYINRSTRA